MTLSEIAERMQRGLSKHSFEGSLKFDCGTDGVIVLADNAVGREDQDTACTIRITSDNLAKLISGKLNPMTGVMMGKLKVSGDAKVAMKLGELLKA
ncbi:MAG: SCP2 sterol-binding domain-containing protein [Pseudomonadota bacterium]